MVSDYKMGLARQRGGSGRVFKHNENIEIRVTTERRGFRATYDFHFRMVVFARMTKAQWRQSLVGERHASGPNHSHAYVLKRPFYQTIDAFRKSSTTVQIIDVGSVSNFLGRARVGRMPEMVRARPMQDRPDFNSGASRFGLAIS